MPKPAGSMTLLCIASGVLALAPATLARPEPAPPSSAPPPAAPAAPSRPAPTSTAGAPAGETEWERRAARFGGVEWITRPSRDTTMEFSSPQEIEEIAVSGGQAVKRGDLLIRARDGEARAGLEVQRFRAANDAELKNAKANLELAQSRFEAAQEAMKSDAATKAEFDERRIGLDAAKIAVEGAESRMKEESLRAVQLDEQYKRFRLEAPFDGIVDQVFAELGQSLGENKPVVRVVAIDPLWVDAPVDTESTLALRLSPSSRAWVLLDVPGEPVVIEAKVLYVAPTANAASGTRLVRVESPNRALWPAGTRARVRFEPPAPGWMNTAAAIANPASNEPHAQAWGHTSGDSRPQASANPSARAERAE